MSAASSTCTWSAKTIFEVHELIGQGKAFEEAVAGRADIAADDIEAFKSALETFGGGPYRRDLEALLRNGGHVEAIRAALDALHAGDDAAKWLVMLGCLSSASGDRLHLFPVAGARQGKSHVLERVAGSLFPDLFKRYDGASPKALFYEGREDPTFLAGKIVFLDEIADREFFWPLLKKIADSNSDRLEHHTVIERHSAVLVLEGLPVVLIAGAKDVPDDQLNGRFLKVSVDESEEQTKRVLGFISADAAGKGDEAANTIVVRAREILKLIREGGPYRVVVPEAEMIDWAAFGFTQPRVDASTFLKIAKAQALLNRRNRPSFEAHGGKVLVVAAEADIAEAWRLWRAIGPTRDIKLDSNAFVVLQSVDFGETPILATSEIKLRLRGQLAPSTVDAKLDALYKLGLGLIDMERGERHNTKLWCRVLPDADLARMKAGPASTLDSGNFSVSWKAPDFLTPTGRKRAVEEWAVSTVSTLSTGFEKTDADELAEWIVNGRKPASGTE